MSTIFWTAYCNNERIVATSEIEKTINNFGYIIDFKQFSDISISIQIEMEELYIDNLFDALKKDLFLDDFPKINSSSKRERLEFLNITFVKGTGNLRIEIPAIPG